jgi:hypothetical protein
VPTIGKNCSCRRSSASGSKARMGSCVPTRPTPKPEIYAALEERGVKYAIRIPSNDSRERDIAELLTRPVGRPGHKPVVWYKSSLLGYSFALFGVGWWGRLCASCVEIFVVENVDFLLTRGLECDICHSI